MQYSFKYLPPCGSDMDNVIAVTEINAASSLVIRPFEVTMLFCAMFMCFFLNVDGAMHFIYSHKYNTNSAEDSSDMN